MKKQILILLLCIISLSCFSQQIRKAELIPYRKGAKWGYADTNAKIVIETKFDSVSFFWNKGMAVVRKDKKLLVITPNGKVVFQSKALGNNIEVLDSNFLQLFDRTLQKLTLYGIKEGIIQTKGLDYSSYDYTRKVVSFTNNNNREKSLYSLIQHKWLDGTEFYADYENDWDHYHPPGPFYIFMNLLPNKEFQQNTKIGVYHPATHQLVTSIEGAQIKAFNKERFIVYSETVGDWLGKMQKVSVYSSKDFSLLFSLQCKMMFIENNLYHVQGENGCGIADAKGAITVPFIYKQIKSYKNGYIATVNDSIVELLDLQGKIFKKFNCFEINEIENDGEQFLIISKYDKTRYGGQLWGCCNLNGDIVIPLKYDFVGGDFGCFYVSLYDEKYNHMASIFDKKGKPLLPFELGYSGFQSLCENLVVGKKSSAKYPPYQVGELIDIHTKQSLPYYGTTEAPSYSYQRRPQLIAFKILNDKLERTRTDVYDSIGNFLFQSDFIFTYIHKYVKNYYIAQKTDESGSYVSNRYLLNSKGQNALPKEYEFVGREGFLNAAPLFRLITKSTNKDSIIFKYAIIDTLGNVVILPHYEVPIKDEYSAIKQQGKFDNITATYFHFFIAENIVGTHVFTPKGKELFSCKERISEQYSSDFYNYIGFSAFNKNQKFLGYYDTKGNKYFED